MDEVAKKKINNWFLIITLICCFVVVIVSFYYFFFKKDFDFIVETACDPSAEECFERDCTNPDDCPPNGLSNFKRYTLGASDFKSCTDEDCALACTDGTIECEQIACEEDPEWGETCVSPENQEISEIKESI